MAITDPQAVKFSNDRVRTLADAAAKYYWAAKAFALEWDATSMGTLIPSDGAETVVDGSAEDGRMPITGLDINNLKAHTDAMLTDLEANSSAKLGILLQIEVNGSP
jgi:hypothetical protein